MATSFLATGADFVSQAQSNFNTTGPGQDGVLSLNGGQKPFPDDFVIEFFVRGEDANGELVNGAAYTGFKVYASADDFNNGVVLHDYVPQNPNQTGTIQADGSGSGDCYSAFNNIFVSSTGPNLGGGRIFVAPGTGAANQIGTFQTRRFEDLDFNNDGDTTDPGEAGNGLFNVNKDTAICMAPGTLLEGANGAQPVEALRVGDRLVTRDNGLQAIRWIGYKDVERWELARDATLLPVRIAPGALGNDAPHQPLLLSPNHRLLLTGQEAQLYFGEPEVFAPVKHLVGLAGVTRQPALRVRYYHLLFDRHEVIRTNGAWSESFLPGEYALSSTGEATRGELLRLFPELAADELTALYPLARGSLRAHEAALLK
ncbi:MAG: Hint domain-containing protein [Pseudomonadota bacterium]